MNPSFVRARILEDHASLRRQLKELEQAVDEMHGDPSQCDNVIEIACQILTALVKHTELEDSILAPALREIDAWGSIRATLLLDHHATQRTQLRELVEDYERPENPERIARFTLAWIREVRADMAHEEMDVLSAALLKDDPIAVAMESG